MAFHKSADALGEALQTKDINKMNEFKAIISTRKTGSEPFHINGTPLEDRLLSFWQWSSSELVGNVLRGVLAEFIVASDLGCISDVRQEWDAYDIETLDGIKVEVKSIAQWKFYVLSTAVLNRELEEQATITLSSLKRLNPIQAEYGKIGNAIKQALELS